MTGGRDNFWRKSSAVARLVEQGLPPHTAPLRLGLLCDDRTFEAWEAEAITCLLNSGFVSLCLILTTGLPKTTAGKHNGSRTLQERLISILQRASGDRATRRVDLTESLSAVRVVQCSMAEDSGESPTESNAALRAAVSAGELDVLLKFSSANIGAGVVSIPRFGVWGISRTRMPTYSAGPPSFWEIVNGEPVTGGCLFCLTDTESEGVILREGYVKTMGFMPGLALNAISFECARWPTYAVADIVNGSHELKPCGLWNGAEPGRAASWFDILRFLAAVAGNIVYSLRRLALIDEWSVGALEMSAEAVVNGESLRDVVWLPNEADAWYADPIASTVNGKIVALMERMPVNGKAHTRGHIASVVLNEAGWDTPQLALDIGCHLSYPNLVEANGEMFMIPETSQLDEIGLYKAIAFPNQWEKVAVILPGLAAVDATVFEHEGRWWMLCTTLDSDETLLAFYGDNLLGPWHGHKRNPLKIDVRSSRPAGRPFKIQGQLYRPAQDCSHTYGGRVLVQRIVALDPNRWLEEPACMLSPKASWKYNKGLHTLSVVGDVCIIDAKRQVIARNFAGKAAKLMSIMRGDSSGFIKPLTATKAPKRPDSDID